MKGKLKLIGLFTFAFIIFVIAQLLFGIFSKKEGRLKVISHPEAAVFLDNIMKGGTPFENIVKEGVYMLKVVPDGGVASGAASWQRKISIVSGALTYVDIQLESSDIATWADVYWMTPNGLFSKKGGLLVETEPAGALVYLDNDEKGVSPITIDNVAPDMHELSVFMPGFSKRSKKIKITQGYDLHSFVKLALDPSQKAKYTIQEKPVVATAAAQIVEPKNTIKILDTPTGWLRVRDEPTLAGSESARVNPGQRFELVEEQTGWYKIRIDGKTEGWISNQYAEKN